MGIVGSGKVRPAANQQSSLAIQEPQVRKVPRTGRNTSISARQRKPLKPADRRLIQALQQPPTVLFLDIETTGLSRYYDEITVVGWVLNGSYHAYVVGDDPAPLRASLGQAAALVTFNGTLFDLPFLRRAFPGIEFPPLHADLRYLGRRVGLTGGQKAIERELGIAIRDAVQDVDGAEAVLLWHRYLRGDASALRRLIDYNHCDVVGMRHLLDEVLKRLVVHPDLWFEAPLFAKQLVEGKGWADRTAELPCATRLVRPRNTFLGLFGGSPAQNATVVGIDLTGSEVRPSGWCELNGSMAKTAMVSTDDDLISRVKAVQPDLVSIDSPLSLPLGRTRVTDDDPARATHGIMRQCERELKRRGINVYPCLLPSMQRLTERGIRLATRLRKCGIPVIESYPGAAQDIMGIPRKGAGVEFLRQGLMDFGVVGGFTTAAVGHDELDAITSALVGSFFLAGKFEALSGPAEDPLIIPKMQTDVGSLVIGVSGKIAAGKTTTARLLERKGFAYTRFSLVVDDEIASRGLTPNSALRQTVGWELHGGKGQRWMAERVLEKVGRQSMIVVDGLRFLEDHAFFVERFGPRFVHLHVIAPAELRAGRYLQKQLDGRTFETADSALVEAEIPELGKVADIVLKNDASLDQLRVIAERSLDNLIHRV